MPIPIACLAAKGVVRDADSNNISVYNIIEQLNPEAFPGIFPELSLLGIWRRVDNEGPSDLQLVITNNQHQLSDSVVRLDFGTTTRSRTIVSLQGMPVLEPGRLRFEFRQHGALLSSYEIVVDPAAPRVQAVGDPPH